MSELERRDSAGKPYVAIYNLGCKVNQYEAEALAQDFRENGYRVVDFSQKADIYIINSCAVTTSAASKSRKVARRAKRRGGEESIVIMAGCYSQVSPEEVEEIEEIDHIIGSEKKDELVDIVGDISREEDWLAGRSDYEEMDSFPRFSLERVRSRTRANIKIQDGCDQFCSYCIIPYARGRKRSRSTDSVVEEVRNLIENDVKEFVLTGIHLGAYGEDFAGDDEDHLTRLLQKLLTLEGDFRLRLSSIEAKEITEGLVELMRENDRLCSHLHLPLQSGSDKILKRMNRPYTTRDFKEQVSSVRKEIPEIAISTDVMVGFPGETDEDFVRTLQLVRDIGFSRLHVFSYSRREGTRAAGMDDQIDDSVKKARSEELRKLARKLQADYEEKFLQRELEVLLESRRDDGSFAGYSQNYIRVKVESTQELANTFQNVKLKEIKRGSENPAGLV